MIFQEHAARNIMKELYKIDNFFELMINFTKIMGLSDELYKVI